MFPGGYPANHYDPLKFDQYLENAQNPDVAPVSKMVSMYRPFLLKLLKKHRNSLIFSLNLFIDKPNLADWQAQDAVLSIHKAPESSIFQNLRKFENLGKALE